MSFDDNIYYSPEKHGLRPVAELDFSSGSYEFDYTVAWVDENKVLYWADDSGCSCPAPFEDYTSVGDLSTGTPEALRRHLIERQAGQYENYVSMADVIEAVHKVQKALR